MDIAARFGNLLCSYLPLAMAWPLVKRLTSAYGTRGKNDDHSGYQLIQTLECGRTQISTEHHKLIGDPRRGSRKKKHKSTDKHSKKCDFAAN